MGINANWRFNVQRAFASNSYSLRMGSDRTDDKFDLATNIVFETIDPHSVGTDRPLFDLSPESAQRLIDALWEAGLRPSNEVGSEGERQALKAHIVSLEKTVSLLFATFAVAPRTE